MEFLLGSIYKIMDRIINNKFIFIFLFIFLKKKHNILHIYTKLIRLKNTRTPMHIWVYFGGA